MQRSAPTRPFCVASATRRRMARSSYSSRATARAPWVCCIAPVWSGGSRSPTRHAARYATSSSTSRKYRARSAKSVLLEINERRQQQQKR